MKKNSTLYNDEIDLIAIFKIIWDSKIKIIFITIISFLVGFGYSYQIPKNYLNSLTVNKSQNYELIKIVNLQELMKLSKINEKDPFNKLLLMRFVDEIEDHISKLKIDDQEIKLYDYSALLDVVLSKENNKEKYIVNFTWHDPNEAKKIIQDTLNLSLNNLKKKLFDEFVEILESEKKIIFSKDVERIEFLKEQSIIAKELNIEDNQIDQIIFPHPQSNISLNNNSGYDHSDTAYFLRGHKAIDKEIELIQNRDYQKFKFIEQEIDILRDAEIDLVKYEINSIDVRSLKKTRLILIISILSGLMVGIFYVLISNIFQSQTAQIRIKKKFK